MASAGMRVPPTSFSRWFLQLVEVLDCYRRRLNGEVEVEGFDPVMRSGEGQAQCDRGRTVAGERSGDKDDRLGHRQLRATGKIERTERLRTGRARPLHQTPQGMP